MFDCKAAPPDAPFSSIIQVMTETSDAKVTYRRTMLELNGSEHKASGEAVLTYTGETP